MFTIPQNSLYRGSLYQDLSVQLLFQPTHRKGGKCGTKAYCLVEYGGCGGSGSMVLLARVLLGLCSLMAGPYPYFSRFTVKSEHCRNEQLSS